jgi:hypothetical protein
MKVTSIMLLKTHIEKMSETGLSIICMKTRHIKGALHYIYENKSFIKFKEQLRTGLAMDNWAIWRVQGHIRLASLGSLMALTASRSLTAES